MTPFYSHLAGIPGYDAAANIDKIGLLAVTGVAAAFGGHGLVQIGRARYDKKKAEQAAAAAAAAEKKSEGGES
jgi:hypothetical protein